MNIGNQTLTIRVFSTTTLKGSLQSITFVPSKALLKKPPTLMEPDIDYTVAYFDGDSHVDVVWRNHHNTIQFCGSAAYGISYYLIHVYGLPHLTIQSPNITLQAEYDCEVSLYIPAKTINLSSMQLFNYGRLYHHPESGIYFLEIEDKDVLQQWYLTEEDLYNLPLDNLHGLCLFYWHSSTHTGYLRYFTPWHGRIEDSVTGSIQSYLTPFIAQMYGIASQAWIQLSQNGGHIKTMFMNDKVCLQGNCQYELHFVN